MTDSSFPLSSSGGPIQPANPATCLNLTKKDGEFLRVLASVSVVIAHCIHFWVVDFYKTRDFVSVSYLSVFLDQFTRFTVPLFFFLSGLGLSLQFRNKALTLREYYRFRLLKILAPFLLWSSLTAFRHIDYIHAMSWSQNPWGSTGLLFKFLFLDGFDYQYYFLIVIFQFYLVFPFVYKLGQSRFWMGFFLLLHLALMSPMETFLGLAGMSLPKIHSNLLILHWFYCFAGVFVACNGQFLSSFASRFNLFKAVGFWVFSLLLVNLEFQVNIHGNKSLYEADHFNRWSVVLYCIASLLLFLKAKDKISAKFYSDPAWRFLFTLVAPYTFFVYLAHTHILRGVDFLFWEVTFFDYLNRIILVVAGTYLLAWFAQWLLEDYPGLRFALGLPKKPPLNWSELPGASLFRIRSLRGAEPLSSQAAAFETEGDPAMARRSEQVGG